MANASVTLTRKHFQLIAETIRLLPSFETYQKDDNPNSPEYGGYSLYPIDVVNFDAVVHRFAEALAGTNPRFSKTRFMSACYGDVREHIARQAAGKHIRCNQCEALMINGIFCHETGCPNTHSRYDVESGEWIKQRECFECGCWVDVDDSCCADTQQAA